MSAWYAVIDIRDPSTGKRKRKWHSLPNCKGKREAQAESARLVTQMKGGEYVEPSKLTLSQFFDRWLKHIKPNVSERTHERYEDLLNKNLAPFLSAKILSKLQPIDISGAYAKLLETGRSDGEGGLSPRTINHIHRALYSALGQAERWRLIARNPAALLEKRDRPKIERKAGRHDRRVHHGQGVRTGGTIVSPERIPNRFDTFKVIPSLGVRKRPLVG